MDRTYENIINEGKKNGKSYEEINEELKAAGATFHLDYKACEGVPETGWSGEEMQEGFIPDTEPARKVVHLHDCFGRKVDKAGQVVLVSTAEGRYNIHYNENGYVVKAIRV